METAFDIRENTDTQKKKILQYLLQGNYITPMIAVEKFNCMKLTNRIAELQKQYDLRIDRMYNTKVNEDGNRVVYMSYWLTSSQIQRLKKIKK
jgi:hypothetical protein